MTFKDIAAASTPQAFLRALRTLFANAGPVPLSGLAQAVPLEAPPALAELLVMDHREAANFYRQHPVDAVCRLVHSLANIELSACMGYLLLLTRYTEAICLPEAFYAEGSEVMRQEIDHFFLLAALLEGRGLTFGALPANINILRDLAKVDNIVDHIALISLTHEGKGVDAGPRLLDKVRHVPDVLLVLQKILSDEEDHVKFGLKWFDFLMQGRDKGKFYADFLTRFGIKINCPNIEARKRIGFDFYARE